MRFAKRFLTTIGKKNRPDGEDGTGRGVGSEGGGVKLPVESPDCVG